MSAAQSQPSTGPAVIVPGNHDGVHRGHCALVQQAADHARAEGLRVKVLTFDPHPAAVLAPERAPTPLTTAARRVELLRGCGASEVHVQHFDLEFASQSPEQFVDWLQRAGARAVLVGPDFRFGKDRAGDVQTLRELGVPRGIELLIADEVQVGGERVSSSLIREAVAAGNLARATELLGRLHEVTGEVVEGHRRGRLLGFPTANLAPEPVLLPCDGVYAVVARVLAHPDGPTEDGATGDGPTGDGPTDDGPTAPLWGVANIGKRPTFDAGRSVEVHLLDWTGDIYGKQLRVGFVARIRGEEKFSSVGALEAQIRVDCQSARATLADSEQGSWAWI